MTITREQLELAARAAGIECKWVDGLDRMRIRYTRPNVTGWEDWNPFTDHGQLLDLAMACKINILVSFCCIEYEVGGHVIDKMVDCQDFPALAEAVITAAAEQQQAKETKE